LLKIAEEQEKERFKNEIVKFEVNKSFTDISDLIKQNTSMALVISNGLLKHSLFMMDYYAKEIKGVIENAGSSDKLTAEDKLKIEHYDKKINTYKREIQFMLPPAQVTNYLRALGVYDDLGGVKENDEFAVTPDRILALMEEIGIGNNIVGNSADKVDEMIKSVHRDSALSVEVNGRIVAEKDMSERKKARFKRIESDDGKKKSK
jgi:hypothetical protein